MTLTLKINLIIYASLLILCVVTATVIYIRAKKTPEFYSLTAFYLCLMFWTALYMNELMSTSEARMYFNVRLTLIPTMFVGALFLIFALYYAGKITLTNRTKIILLILLPELLCVWPLFTQRYFHLVLVSKVFGGYHDVWGPLMIVSEVFTFLYIIAAVVLIGKKLRSRGKKYVWLLAFAVSIPLVLQVLQVLVKPLTELGVYLTLPGFAFFCVLITVYVLKYRLIEVVPAASHKLFSMINKAVFILDAGGEVIESNEAAALYFQNMIEIKPYMDFEKVFDALVPYCDDKNKLEQMKSRAAAGETGAYEGMLVLQATATGNRQYAVDISPIFSGSGKLLGKLVVFNDMTEFTMRTLAGERSRVSDDLHDSLGNSINVISSNLEYVLNNFADTPEVRECLQISYDRAIGAFVQLRRIVDELTPVDIEQRGLLWALDILFYKLRVKGLNIDFSHNIGDDSRISKSKLAKTVYRICQEAINNAVVHGRAKNIAVTLHEGDGSLKVFISDDGVGCEHITPSNGLNAMRNRVESLGGKLSLGSPDGGGFNIKATFPFDIAAGETPAEPGEGRTP